MNPLLRAEVLKLRTTRTFAALALIAVGTSILIAFLVALLTEPTKDSVLVDVYAADTSSFFVLVLAVIGVSGEWRHRTISGALLAAPERTRFLAAKAAAFAVAGAVLSLMIAAAVAITGTVVLSVRGLPLAEFGELSAQVARNAFVAAGLGAFGVAVGALVRNQVVAVVSLLVLSFLIEPVVFELLPAVGRWGPLNALPVAAAGLPPEDLGWGPDANLPATGAAIAALLAWIGGTFAVAAALLRGRDLE
jgi:hypothetical protein